MLGFCLSYEGENYFTLIAGVKNHQLGATEE